MIEIEDGDEIPHWYFCEKCSNFTVDVTSENIDNKDFIIYEKMIPYDGKWHTFAGMLTGKHRGIYDPYDRYLVMEYYDTDGKMETEWVASNGDRHYPEDVWVKPCEVVKLFKRSPIEVDATPPFYSEWLPIPKY